MADNYHQQGAANSTPPYWLQQSVENAVYQLPNAAQQPQVHHQTQHQPQYPQHPQQHQHHAEHQHQPQQSRNALPQGQMTLPQGQLGLPQVTRTVPSNPQPPPLPQTGPEPEPTPAPAPAPAKRGRGRPRGLRKPRASRAKASSAAPTSTASIVAAATSAAALASPAPPRPKPVITPSPRDEDIYIRPPPIDDPNYQTLLAMQGRFYTSYEKCLDALLDIALKLGFGAVIKRSKRLTSVNKDTGQSESRVYRYDIECTAGRSRAVNIGVRTVARKDCPWTAQITSEKKNGGLWAFKIVHESHNHAPFPDAAAIPVHRRQTLKRVATAVRLLGAQEGTSAKEILDFCTAQQPDRPLKMEDIKNFLAREKKLARGEAVPSEYADGDVQDEERHTEDA